MPCKDDFLYLIVQDEYDPKSTPTIGLRITHLPLISKFPPQHQSQKDTAKLFPAS